MGWRNITIFTISYYLYWAFLIHLHYYVLPVLYNSPELIGGLTWIGIFIGFVPFFIYQRLTGTDIDSMAGFAIVGIATFFAGFIHIFLMKGIMPGVFIFTTLGVAFTFIGWLTIKLELR